MSDETYVLVQLRETAAPARVASRAARLPGVGSVAHVTGPFDLVIRMERLAEDDVAGTLAGLRGIPGVLRALACVRIPTEDVEPAPSAGRQSAPADLPDRADGLPAGPAG